MEGTAENLTAYNEVCHWLKENSEKENKVNIPMKLHLFVHGDLDILLAMLRATGPYYHHRYLLGADRTSKIWTRDAPLFVDLTYRKYKVIFPANADWS